MKLAEKSIARPTFTTNCFRYSIATWGLRMAKKCIARPTITIQLMFQILYSYLGYEDGREAHGQAHTYNKTYVSDTLIATWGMRMAEKPMARPTLSPGRLAITPANTWSGIFLFCCCCKLFTMQTLCLFGFVLFQQHIK